MIEPELITIIEGPTPDFHPAPQGMLQAVLQGPVAREVVVCQLRTATGEDILDRCQQAWRDGRPVLLDYPDPLRLRQQADVAAMRLEKTDEGQVLMLWIALPFSVEEDEEYGQPGEEDEF